ncbi:MAG: ribonuclease P protein component [Brevinematales bacterium]|nr:ribonuclease P protein component [Brevinematales bacterium]
MKNLNQGGNSLKFPVKFHRIRKLKDFRNLLQNGKIIKSQFWIVRFIRNNQNMLRIAVSISKKVNKKSTKRNRIRRITTEVLRLNQHLLKGIDIWFQIKLDPGQSEIKSKIENVINEIHSRLTNNQRKEPLD